MTEAPPPCEECEWYLTHTDGGQHAKALHAEIAELRAQRAPRCARCGHRSDYHNESMLDSPCWQDFGLTIPQECECHAFVPPADKEGT